MSNFSNQYPPREQVSLPSVAGVVGLLRKAQDNGLKYPKLWLQFADGGDLRVSVAGSQSRTPGFLMLTDGRPFGENCFYGRISPEGVLELGRDAGPRRDELVPLLSRLACEPAKVAAEYGHLTGNCCFCSKQLADERSIAVGYGKICAKKFGLPWGAAAAQERLTPNTTEELLHV